MSAAVGGEEQKKNMRVGDVVLLKEEGVVRGQWPMGRVTEVHPGEDGLVRSVMLKTEKSVFQRPVHKTVFLVTAGAEEDV